MLFRSNDLKGNVLVLLNGRRAGTGNLAKIMTENVERIEIIRGPASVQYGSAAIGGLVNVITKKGEGKPSAFVEGKLGSYGYEKGSAGFSGKIKGLDFSGSYSRSSQDDYTTADGKKYHNTGFDKKEHASVNLGYEFVPDNRIGLVYTGFDADDIGDPGRLSLNDLDDYSYKSNESLDFVYDGSALDGSLTWNARYFFGEDDNKWVDPVASDPGGAMFGDDGNASHRNVDSKGAQAQFTFDHDKYQLTAGIDWVNYQVESDYSGKYEYDNPSYFVLGKAGLMQKTLNLSAGIRYDDYVVEKHKQEEKDNVTPKLGISWLPHHNLKFRINYSQGFRMPSGDALFGSAYKFDGKLGNKGIGQ